MADQKAMLARNGDRSILAEASVNLGFLRLGRQFVAAPTFSAKPLRGCHLVKQIAGKP